MVLLISYDLNGHERPSAYAAIKSAIETKSISRIRPLYSQWFVTTNDSPATWANYLKSSRVVDGNDRLFITRVTSGYQGWLTKEDWAWLNSQVL